MKTKRFLIALLCLTLLLLVFAGCSKSATEEGPDDIPIQLVPAGNVIGKYSKDDTDYSSLPE